MPDVQPLMAEEADSFWFSHTFHDQTGKDRSLLYFLILDHVYSLLTCKSLASCE